MNARTCLAAVGIVFALAATGRAPASETGWTQKLGARLPLDEVFTDDTGRAGRLGDFVSGKPVILVFAYYGCPNLCTLVLNGLTDALRSMDEKPGRDYQLLAVSIDPNENPRLALMKKRTYLTRLGIAPETSWLFLTGEAQAIAALTSAAGFGYRYDATSRQFEHPSGLVVLSADGRIRQYLTGIRFDPKALSKALKRSSRFQSGSVIDQVLLTCFHYDPSSSRTGTWVLLLIRIAGALSAVTLLTGLARAIRAEGRA